jgi:hypothetical protein
MLLMGLCCRKEFYLVLWLMNGTVFGYCSYMLRCRDVKLSATRHWDVVVVVNRCGCTRWAAAASGQFRLVVREDLATAHHTLTIERGALGSSS